MRRWFAAVLIAWSAVASLLAEEDPGFVHFPAPKADVELVSYRTSFAAATDVEDEYPVVLAVMRKGVPLWSEVATIDPAWPFRSLDFKVAWSADARLCVCAYRRNRSSLAAFAVDLT